MFDNIYKNKRVLLTGDTGFKGSWLRLWLEKLGAVVQGYSQKPQTTPSHFALLNFPGRPWEELTDRAQLARIVDIFEPDIVFHLAAQAIVRTSYQTPLETLQTNIIGTANVLDVCRTPGTVQAIVVVTSDKCYENREQIWGYRETDPMGGYDPYSVSKGCAELIAASYRNSFFQDASTARIATARAGNVIGGGDWSKDRLTPDVFRAVHENRITEIRSPNATRPWQHVLEPLSGYLLLGQRLIEQYEAENRQNASKSDSLAERSPRFDQAWNFGPAPEGIKTVFQTLLDMKKVWNKIQFKANTPDNAPHEAKLLSLDCTKANQLLDWRPTWNWEQTIAHTVDWYRKYEESGAVVSEADLSEYCAAAQEAGNIWS